LKHREVIAVAVYFCINIANIGMLLTPIQTNPTQAGVESANARLAAAKLNAKLTAKPPAKPPAKAKSPKTASSSRATGAIRKPPNIGIFITSSPSDPSSLQVLDWVSSAGMNTVYNYTPFDGSPEQVGHYLDYAQSKGIKIIFSLHNLYDQSPEAAQVVRDYPQYGHSPEEIALNVVRLFQAHPAVWGFSLTDEQPEDASGLATWQPILAARQAKLKSLTAKPTMGVLEGWSNGQASARGALLSGVKPTVDQLALDYYPIPFEPPERWSTIGGELSRYDPSGWAIVQSFSWGSYPGTAQSLGFNLNNARPPSAAEMTSMAQQALAGGARNILFYSYFDIKNSPAQLNAVSQAVRNLSL
jgi:hypothetical protein